MPDDQLAEHALALLPGTPPGDLRYFADSRGRRLNEAQ
ncbi:hypothetical protein C1703_18980 [Streptomyces sp. Go-475]|nr:hypothetical protein C1703_18980 [Streptomyces sp. Go-475]